MKNETMRNLKERAVAMKNHAAVIGTGLAITAMNAVPALAADGDSASASVATTMQTAFTAVQSDFNATVTAIAPIGVGICGVFLVWKFGLKFFKAVTGKA